MSFRRRVRRARSGGYEVRLATEERALLAALPAQLVGLLESVGDEPTAELPEAVRRLLPPAHSADDEAEQAYIALMRADLVEHHKEALDVLAETATATHLDDEQLAAWLGALNDLRLALGSMLGVTEADIGPPASGPHEAEWIAYHYLGSLQSEVIDLLTDALPPPQPGADDLVPEDTWGEPPGGLRWDGTPQPPPGEFDW